MIHSFNVAYNDVRTQNIQVVEYSGEKVWNIRDGRDKDFPLLACGTVEFAGFQSSHGK